MLCLWLKQDSVRFVNILVRITWVPRAQLLMPFGTALMWVTGKWHVSCAVWLLFSSQAHTSIFWAPSTLLQIAPLQNSWSLLLPLYESRNTKALVLLSLYSELRSFLLGIPFPLLQLWLVYSIDLIYPNSQMWLWLNLHRYEVQGSIQCQLPPVKSDHILGTMFNISDRQTTWIHENLEALLLYLRNH